LLLVALTWTAGDQVRASSSEWGDEELDVPVPRAVVAEEGPEEIDTTEVRAPRRMIAGDPLVATNLPGWSVLVARTGSDQVAPASKERDTVATSPPRSGNGSPRLA